MSKVREQKFYCNLIRKTLLRLCSTAETGFSTVYHNMTHYVMICHFPGCVLVYGTMYM